MTRLTNASKVLSINLGTGAVSDGGTTFTTGDRLDIRKLFNGAPAFFLSVEDIPSGATLQLSTNENEEFFEVFEGDTLEDEIVTELYFKRTGSGAAKVRLNAWVKKKHGP